MEAPLPKDPKLRKLVEEGRCETYVANMRTFVDEQLELAGEDAKAKASEKVESVSNAHFSNAFVKALVGIGLSTNLFFSTDAGIVSSPTQNPRLGMVNTQTRAQEKPPRSHNLQNDPKLKFRH